MNLVGRILRLPLSKPTWKAGARLRDDARKHVALPRRWGQPDERFAFHYQFHHIKGERMVRAVLAGRCPRV